MKWHVLLVVTIAFFVILMAVIIIFAPVEKKETLKPDSVFQGKIILKKYSHGWAYHVRIDQKVYLLWGTTTQFNENVHEGDSLVKRSEKNVCLIFSSKEDSLQVKFIK